MGITAKLNQHLQDAFLYLAITDDHFLKLVYGHVEPKHFTSALTQDLIQLCFDYFAQFSKAPSDHFHDEVVRLLLNYPDEQAETYVRYVAKIQALPAPNKQYVLNRVGDFVKRRTRELALIEAVDLLEHDQIAKADNVLHAALQSGISEQDAGLDYLRDFGNLIEREPTNHLISTGIPALTRLIGGFDRGQLVVTLGGYKAGKTWWLMHLARTAVCKGLRVLHISHEVGELEMEIRYDMMFSRRGTKRIGEAVTYLVCDKKTGALQERHLKIESVFDAKPVIKTRQTVERLGGDLRIKKYPMGQCPPAEVERLLNYLETYEGFVPDVVLIDYLDIMDLTGYSDELRHRLNAAYLWAKGLADDRQILVATVSQVTRRALEARYVSMKDVAEDARKAGNCDIMLAIGRGPQEVKSNLAGVSVLANRSGLQSCHCTISLCYDIGQFCLSSWTGREMDAEAFEHFGETGDADK